MAVHENAPGKNTPALSQIIQVRGPYPTMYTGDPQIPNALTGNAELRGYGDGSVENNMVA